MPRPLRADYGGQIYHALNRGGPAESAQFPRANPPYFFPVEQWNNCFLALQVHQDLLDFFGIPVSVYPDGYSKQG